MMHVLASYKKLIVAFLAPILLILCLRFSRLQEAIIFSGAWLSVGKEKENIAFFLTKDKTKLSYKKYGAHSSNKVIVCFLGKGESITHSASSRNLHRLSKELGVTIYALDYPGYGLSEGTIRNEEQFYENTYAFFAHVKKVRGCTDKDIYLLGRSIGGAPAIDIASRHNVGGVIICYTFISLYEVACDKISRPLAWLLLRYTLDNISKIPNIQCPVIAFHPRQDRVVHFTHGEKLRDAGKVENYTFYPYDGYHMRNHPDFYRIVREFINK